MKKMCVFTMLCLMTATVATSCLGYINLGRETVLTLYTVSGIMFSIGISLTVVSNTIGVRNQEIRKKIRQSIKSVRNNFIMCFSLATLIYILTAPCSDKENQVNLLFKIRDVSVSVQWPLFALMFMLYSITYFIVNFIAIQQLNEDIEEELNKACPLTAQ